MGLAMAPFFNIVLAGVDDEETGSASGALTSVQQLGGAFGIAVLGTIFFALLPGAVADHVDGSAAELRTRAHHGRRAGRRPAGGRRRVARLPARPDDGEGPRRGAGELPYRRLRDGSGRRHRGVRRPSRCRAGFRDTTIRTTGVALVLLLLALGLSFLLPRHARPDTEGAH